MEIIRKDSMQLKIISSIKQLGRLPLSMSSSLTQAISSSIEKIKHYFSNGYDQYLRKFLNTRSFYLSTEEDDTLLGNFIYKDNRWVFIVYAPFDDRFEVKEDPVSGKYPSQELKEFIKEYFESIPISTLQFYKLTGKFGHNFQKLKKIKAQLKHEGVLEISQDKVVLGNSLFNGKYANNCLDLFLQSNYLYVSDTDLFPHAFSSIVTKVFIGSLLLTSAFQQRQRLLKLGGASSSLLAAGGLASFIQPVGASFNCTAISTSYFGTMRNNRECLSYRIVLGNTVFNPTSYNQSLMLFDAQRSFADCSSLRTDNLNDCRQLSQAILDCGLTKEQMLEIFYALLNKGVQRCKDIFPDTVLAAQYAEEITTLIQNNVDVLSHDAYTNFTILAASQGKYNQSLVELQTTSKEQSSEILQHAAALQSLQTLTKSLEDKINTATKNSEEAKSSAEDSENAQLIAILTAIFLLILLGFQVKGFVMDVWGVIVTYSALSNVFEFRLKKHINKLNKVEEKYRSLLGKSSENLRIGILLDASIIPASPPPYYSSLSEIEQKVLESFLLFNGSLYTVKQKSIALSDIMLGGKKNVQAQVKPLKRDAKKQLENLINMRKALNNSLKALKKVIDYLIIEKEKPEIESISKQLATCDYLCKTTIAMLLKKFNKWPPIAENKNKEPEELNDNELNRETTVILAEYQKHALLVQKYLSALLARKGNTNTSSGITLAVPEEAGPEEKASSQGGCVQMAGTADDIETAPILRAEQVHTSYQQVPPLSFQFTAAPASNPLLRFSRTLPQATQDSPSSSATGASKGVFEKTRLHPVEQSEGNKILPLLLRGTPSRSSSLHYEGNLDFTNAVSEGQSAKTIDSVQGVQTITNQEKQIGSTSEIVLPHTTSSSQQEPKSITPFSTEDNGSFQETRDLQNPDQEPHPFAVLTASILPTSTITSPITQQLSFFNGTSTSKNPETNPTTVGMSQSTLKKRASFYKTDLYNSLSNAHKLAAVSYFNQLDEFTALINNIRTNNEEAYQSLLSDMNTQQKIKELRTLITNIRYLLDNATPAETFMAEIQKGLACIAILIPKLKLSCETSPILQKK